jgi:hypothetical protein
MDAFRSWHNLPTHSPSPPTGAPAFDARPVIDAEIEMIHGEGEPTLSPASFGERPAEPFADEEFVQGDDILKQVAKAGVVGALVGSALFVAPRLFSFVRKAWPR